MAILNTGRFCRAVTRWIPALRLLMLATLILPLAPIRAAHGQSSRPVYEPIAPENLPASDVFGIVNDESGKPVQGVSVLAVHGWKTDVERRTIQTDSNGRFSFENLADGDWHYSVNDPRYGWEWDYERGVVLPAKAEDLPLVIRLYGGRTVRGKVLENSGRPVAGVRVILVDQFLPGGVSPVCGHLNNDFLIAQTDSAGDFVMQRLRPGKAKFLLEHPRYAKTLADAEIDGKDVSLTIREGLTLRGKVMHDGQPLEGVKVQAGIAESWRPMVQWQGRTDAKGQFEIPRIRPVASEGRPSGRLSVSASVKDSAWYSDHYQIYQTDDQLPDLVIEAHPLQKGERPKPGSVEVRKPSATQANKQESGARGVVNVRIAGGANGPALAMVQSLTPGKRSAQMMQGVKDGLSVFQDLPAGRYIVSGLGGKNGPARVPKTIELAAGQTLDVALEPGPGRITGVIRSGGKALGGGYVNWFISPRIPGAVFQGAATVQPDGNYAIEGLMEGGYQLVHQAPNSMPHAYDVKVGKEPVRLDLDLPTARIQGTLVGRTPKPKNPAAGLPGSIFVRPRGVPPMLGNNGCFVEANSDGRFVVEHLSPGQYSITGYDLATTVNIQREDSIASAVLRAPEKAGEIGGFITAAGPLANSEIAMQVTAFPKDELGYDFGVWNSSSQRNPKTGAYRLRDLPPGIYGVLVIPDIRYRSRAPMVWVSEIEVRDGLARDLSIEIPLGRTVSIRTRNQESLDPAELECKRWRLHLPSGDWLDHTIFTGSSVDGDFGLPLGEYTIQAEYDKGQMVRQKFTVVAGEGEQVITIRGQK